MKKKTLAILFLGFMGLKSVANPVSPEEARQVAERFFRNLGAEDGTSMDVRRSPVALRSSRPGGSPYYICAPRSGSGFVVVSGDDALPPVVGYSLERSFHPSLKDFFRLIPLMWMSRAKAGYPCPRHEGRLLRTRP